MKTIAELDYELTRPSEALIAFVKTIEGPLVVLGAGGKMGPSLCAMVKRAALEASYELDVIAVSRFSDPKVRSWLEKRGVQTLSCDLFEEKAVALLPDAQHVIYLVGLKFGTQQNPAMTWAANVLVPANIAKRYPDARMVALSTGNVYPLVDTGSSGSKEGDPLTPIGEYANACVARERVFEYFTQTSPLRLVLVRLNYAVELRYGVLIDLAQRLQSGDPIDVTMGYFNCIWQRDANDMIVRSLDLATSAATVLNLTGRDTLSTREVALNMATMMHVEANIVGREAPTALLNDATRAHAVLGGSDVELPQVLEWTTAWVQRGGEILGKPTHFEVRDGSY